MSSIIFKNACIFDGHSADCPSGMHVRVDSGLIQEISSRPIAAGDGLSIDVGGRTLMPGMIDAHVHAYFSHVHWPKVDRAGEAYRMAHAVRVLAFALDCGFTTVRDIGGGDYSLWRVIQDGLIRAPRFFYAGRMISMTGGHGDTRPMEESGHIQGYCSCGNVNALNVVADGVDACVRAVREEFRRGAHCIKIMASGGVASPTDPIWMNQYRLDEIAAIVSEATERRSYVSAHCHPASAMKRCLESGVRVIEHGSLMDDATAALVVKHGAFVVPTLSVVFALLEIGMQFGLTPASHEKQRCVAEHVMHGLESMRKASVQVGFGTDLIGETYTRQCNEFALRREVFSPLEILRQATSVNAAILQLEGKLGCVREGAYADLIVVDGDPLTKLELLSANGQNVPVIMRAGEVTRNRL